MYIYVERKYYGLNVQTECVSHPVKCWLRHCAWFFLVPPAVAGGLSAGQGRYPDSKEELSECGLVPTPTDSDLWLEIHGDRGAGMLQLSS